MALHMRGKLSQIKRVGGRMENKQKNILHERRQFQRKEKGIVGTLEFIESVILLKVDNASSSTKV
jgi:hypothetical protein